MTSFGGKTVNLIRKCFLRSLALKDHTGYFPPSPPPLSGAYNTMGDPGYFTSTAAFLPRFTVPKTVGIWQKHHGCGWPATSHLRVSTRAGQPGKGLGEELRGSSGR